MLLQNYQHEFADILVADGLYPDLVAPYQNMRIYKNNMMSNLTRTLMDTYPLLTKLLGEGFFRTAAQAYIDCYPSCSSNLQDYGEYFSSFMATYPPASFLIYLPEVAMFEWACHQIYFAAKSVPMDSASLEAVQEEDYDHLYFMLQPASQLLTFHYPILDIVDLCQGNENKEVNLNEGGVKLLIIRRDLDIALIPLSEDEFAFLSAVRDNQPLSVAVEAALKINPDFQLAVKLASWVKDNVLYL